MSCHVRSLFRYSVLFEMITQISTAELFSCQTNSAAEFSGLGIYQNLLKKIVWVVFSCFFWCYRQKKLAIDISKTELQLHMRYCTCPYDGQILLLSDQPSKSTHLPSLANFQEHKATLYHLNLR